MAVFARRQVARHSTALLRQYMLTLPRELIEAARMDHASEWAIYWRVVLPLSIPAIAVLAIFP